MNQQMGENMFVAHLCVENTDLLHKKVSFEQIKGLN